MTVVPKEQRNKSNAYLVMKQIQAIYREEDKLKELSPDERLMQRQLVIKPLVDALFVYLKKMEPTVLASGQLRKAYTYILNQEKYLRVFLEDGEVPIDNNESLCAGYFYPHLFGNALKYSSRVIKYEDNIIIFRLSAKGTDEVMKPDGKLPLSNPSDIILLIRLTLYYRAV